MTLYASTGRNSLGSTVVCKHIASNISRALVSSGGIGVAILAEINNFLHQQGLVATAVRGMANHAILCDRRVFMDKGSTFVSMAFVAELIGAFSLEHVFCLGTMGVMAIGALDLAFDDWVMGPLVGIGTGIFVTIEANLCLSYGGSRGVDIVAGNTGHIILLVFAHIPQGKMF